jgi:hypothetical protein
MPKGEVRVIFASSGTAGGFRAALPRPQAVLDMFRAPIYASSRWLNGIIEAKPSPRAGAAEKQIPKIIEEGSDAFFISGEKHPVFEMRHEQFAFQVAEKRGLRRLVLRG